MGYLRKVWAITSKDVAAEIHTREILSAMGIYSVLALLIFSFALDLRGTSAQAAAPGVLWVTVTFAGMLGLSRSLARERHTGSVDGLLLAPVDPSAIYLGKALGNLIFMAVVLVVLLPLFSALFDVSLLRADVLAVTLLGTVGYAAAGTLLSAIAVNARAQEVALPILLLPLVVPVLLAAVQAIGGLLDGTDWRGVGSWVRILVVYDLVVVAVALLTFGYALEE